MEEVRKLLKRDTKLTIENVTYKIEFDPTPVTEVPADSD